MALLRCRRFKAAAGLIFFSRCQWLVVSCPRRPSRRRFMRAASAAKTAACWGGIQISPIRLAAFFLKDCRNASPLEALGLEVRRCQDGHKCPADTEPADISMVCRRRLLTPR